MAKIGLSQGFAPIPKGNHVFKIVGVTYKEDFGKMEVTMQIASGQRHIEKFSLLDNQGEPNQKALNAFSYFAKTALNDFSLDEIDEQDLVGHYIRCDVEHEEVESNRTPGKMVTFTRLGWDKEPAEGFDIMPRPETSTTSVAPAAKKSENKKQKFDLDSLLG